MIDFQAKLKNFTIRIKMVLNKIYNIILSIMDIFYKIIM